MFSIGHTTTTTTTTTFLAAALTKSDVPAQGQMQDQGACIAEAVG